MKICVITFPILILSLCTGLFVAMTQAQNLSPATPNNSEMRLGKLTSKPVIDGVMQESEWAGATKVELSYQVEPGDNTKPSERTEVFLACDREHLYAAFHAFDSDPSAIRARVSKRDDVNADDLVVLLLDTYNDRQRAYRFTLNPLGIQQDGIFTEQNVDETWDCIFESKGSITSDGYIVEVAIPFKSLRFQAGKDAKWGLHLRRVLPRRAEHMSWAPVSRDMSGSLVQMGTLAGLDDIYVGRTLDLIPTITGSINSEREFDSTKPAGARLNTFSKFEPGVTAIYSIAPNLTLSATVNPDFSQVEADAPQINVNQRFALFYPERRPFFLEGTEVFRTLSPSGISFLNTRQIIDPDWGVKLTGKIGRNTIGLLSASDRAPGLSVSSTDERYEDKALFTVVRYSRDILKDSALGFFLTDRRFGNESNTLLAADGRLRILSTNTLGVQVVRTRTNDRGGNERDGWASNIRFNHIGRKWRLYAHDRYVSEGYRADAGFINRVGFHEKFLDIGYEWRPKRENKWLVYVWPYVLGTHSSKTDGRLEFKYVDPAVEVKFARNIQLNYYYSFDRDQFAGRILSYQFQNYRLSVGAFKKISYSGNFRVGESINFNSAITVVGKSLNLDQTITLRPSDGLSIELLYLKSNLRDKRTVARFFNQDILRNRTTYQFTKYNAFRGIFDYDTSQRRAGISLIYAYTPSPNTSFFLGYNDSLYNGYEPLMDRRALQGGWFRERRTFFTKLSYNFRL